MADFALGLTKTAVAGTLNRVKSAIEEETKLRVRVENDLVFITGEFQMMQSFLNVANAERAKNEVVRTWVRQIRDLAFDVEDCVEFIIHLDKRSVWSWFWRVVPSFMAPKHTRQLDQAVAEIKQLKARVEDVSQRNTRYNLISHSDSMVETPDLIKAITTDADTSLSAAFHILSEVQDASGKQQSTGDLRKLITSDASDLQVISVWGNSTGVAADLGAACIIRKAYDDPKIRQRFISRAWVKMMHPFNPDELLKSLLAQFYANSHQPNLGAEFSKKMKAAVSLENNELMHQVSEQRYLVVVEELSTMVEWDAIRMYLPDSNNGSRIVVSTQHLGLARLCTEEPYEISELRHFSHGESLCAFSTKGRRPRRRKFSCKKGKEVHGSKGEDAHDLSIKFELVGRTEELTLLGKHMGTPGVISLWGISGIGKSALVKNIYYERSRNSSGLLRELCYFIWVDVLHPFHLTEFSRRLLVDFHSENLQPGDTAAMSIMEGQDPTQVCQEILCQDKFFYLVIDGLRSTRDWDLIKTSLLSEPITHGIVVITNEASVATHCANEKGKVLNVKGLDADTALRLFTEVCYSSQSYDMLSFNKHYGASGKAILGELKKLTQLRKLAISGINHGNWQDMCCTISGHGYLVSLSVRLDDKQEDKGVTYSLGDILVPPKTLECLKLYGGNVHVSPVWMEQLSNLRKAHLELTISTQEEIDSLVKLPNRDMFRRLCVKPIQNGQLFYGLPEQNLLFGKGFAKAPVLKIDCSSCESVIVFGYCTPRYVEVIVVHCPTVGSSLELSGLERLHLLKEVRLQGFYSSTLKRHLEQKVAEHENKPVLKVDDQPTIQSPKSKCPALPACCGST
ncbi:hypothetical protein ACQ4PT_010156 [Festuca glaucescens]